MKLYLGGLISISGCAWGDIIRSFELRRDIAHRLGYVVFNPLACKEGLYDKNDTVNAAVPLNNGLGSDMVILRRDLWMVSQADVIWMDVLGAKCPSIGCVSELTAAYIHNKHSVIVMEPENPHNHPFIRGMGIVFGENTSAIAYLRQLIQG